ncbi:MAG: YdcF family protein [Rhizobiales bacterium]|nr:YdcF family protein [Hyphomicrobiales bacterium]MBO6697277.1 YdcF family protein [Hyphomicrobiales bacterium]MBO6736468.1 YdcF family protein [Hyphomicrobiales bacterium]MBO6912938.1 YdcF family protein [Hyphomicrobiales bacterium]MBO6954106.1 YdcF family protein [Hyphomicrobiales bacterium]
MSDLDLLPSKLLSTLVRPDFWLWLGLLTALWASWRGWRKIATWVLVSLVVAVTLVGFVPVGHLWLAPLENRFSTNPGLAGPPSAIIVLGGGEDIRTSAAWNAQNVNSAGDRILHAIRRANDFPETPVLFTGGAFDPTGDPLFVGSAERVGEMLQASGVAPERVNIGAVARTTAEHPADITAFLEEQGYEPTAEAPLLLITSAFHMPRAIGVLCAAGFEHIVADPTDHRTVPGARWQERIRWGYAGNLSDLQLAIREWAGLVAYQRAGHTDALLPDGC